MSGAVVLGAWVLALGVVAAPQGGLPEPDLQAPGTVDRFALVACLALVAASAPRSRARFTGSSAVAALATVVLFLPIAAVAQELDAQSGQERPLLFATVALLFALVLAWSAEYAGRDERLAARYGLAWMVLLALPAVAASLFPWEALVGPFAWSPLVWCLGPREPAHALLPAASVAALSGLVAVRATSRDT